MNEKLISVFCHVLISILWILYGLTYLALPGKMGLNYYMCTGDNPRVDPYDYKKVPINAIVPVGTLTLYLGMSAKVSWLKTRVINQTVSSSVSMIEASNSSGTCPHSFQRAASGPLPLNCLNMEKNTISFIAIAVNIRDIFSYCYLKVSFTVCEFGNYDRNVSVELCGLQSRAS